MIPNLWKHKKINGFLNYPLHHCRTLCCKEATKLIIQIPELLVELLHLQNRLYVVDILFDTMETVSRQKKISIYCLLGQTYFTV